MKKHIQNNNCPHSDFENLKGFSQNLSVLDNKGSIEYNSLELSGTFGRNNALLFIRRHQIIELTFQEVFPQVTIFGVSLGD